jgi:hypothetical protein
MRCVPGRSAWRSSPPAGRSPTSSSPSSRRWSSGCSTWPGIGGFVLELSLWIVFFNLVLAFFNLLPIPPLDGYNALLAFLPPRRPSPSSATRRTGSSSSCCSSSSRQPARPPVRPRAPADRDPHRCVGSGSSSRTSGPGSPGRGGPRAPRPAARAALELFAAMPVADRRHALDVAQPPARRRPRRPSTCSPPRCFTTRPRGAACGSGTGSGVLLEAVAPRALRRLADPDPASWRHPFHLYLHHGPMSAELAERAGCSPGARRLHARRGPGGRCAHFWLR